MARALNRQQKKFKTALNSQQKKFKTAAKAANATCHRETNSVADYKTCMRREMKAKLGSRKASRKRRRRQ